MFIAINTKRLLSNSLTLSFIYLLDVSHVALRGVKLWIDLVRGERTQEYVGRFSLTSCMERRGMPSI